MHFSTDNILQPFQTTWLPADTRAAMLRLDQLHPLVSGNKWFKLKYNLEAAQGRPVVTFGGAYSNHILATAAACHMQGIHCTGIIRGEKPATLSPTLQKAMELGMQLVFISREEYRRLTQQAGDGGISDGIQRSISQQAGDGGMSDGIQGSISQQAGDSGMSYDIQRSTSQQPGNQQDAAYIIPEGGHNALGAKGCEEILSLEDISGYTHVICAVGTGTTLAGLINSQTPPQITGASALKGAFPSPHTLIPPQENSNPVLKGTFPITDPQTPPQTTTPSQTPPHITGISVLKGAFSLTDATASLLHPGPHAPWKILHDFHGGGYGKCNDELIAFMNDFYRQTGIPLDRVYTGKMTMAVQYLLQQAYFPPGSRLLLVHSGGLQGNDSLPAGVLCY